MSDTNGSQPYHSDTTPLVPGTTLTDERVTMPRIMARNIRAHAQEHVPQEVCGLIGGVGEAFAILMRCPNHANNPEHEFRIESSHAYEFEQECVKKGMRPIALYHSHVGAAAEPSLADTSNIPGELYIVIYSVKDDELRAWRGEKAIDLEVTG